MKQYQREVTNRSPLFFNPVAGQRNHRCPATQALHQVGVKTQAEGHVAAHLRTRGRRHAPNAEAFCPNLTVIPHPMQYSRDEHSPFPSRHRFGNAALTDGKDARDGRNASTSGRQTVKSQPFARNKETTDHRKNFHDQQQGKRFSCPP